MQTALSVDLPHYCFVCVQSLIESQQAIWLPLIQKKKKKKKSSPIFSMIFVQVCEMKLGSSENLFNLLP